MLSRPSSKQCTQAGLTVRIPALCTTAPRARLFRLGDNTTQHSDIMPRKSMVPASHSDDKLVRAMKKIGIDQTEAEQALAGDSDSVINVYDTILYELLHINRCVQKQGEQQLSRTCFEC